MGSISLFDEPLHYPSVRRDESVHDTYHGVPVPDPYRCSMQLIEHNAGMCFENSIKSPLSRILRRRGKKRLNWCMKGRSNSTNLCQGGETQITIGDPCSCCYPLKQTMAFTLHVRLQQTMVLTGVPSGGYASGASPSDTQIQALEARLQQSEEVREKDREEMRRQEEVRMKEMEEMRQIEEVRKEHHGFGEKIKPKSVYSIPVSASSAIVLMFGC